MEDKAKNWKTLGPLPYNADLDEKLLSIVHPNDNSKANEDIWKKNFDKLESGFESAEKTMFAQLRNNMK